MYLSALSFKPKILQRKSIIERVAEKIKTFIDTFIEGMGECLIKWGYADLMCKSSGLIWQY